MNKVRILGIVIFLAGIAGMYLYDNNLINFISGFLVASGFVFVLTGRITTRQAVNRL